MQILQDEYYLQLQAYPRPDGYEGLSVEQVSASSRIDAQLENLKRLENREVYQAGNAICLSTARGSNKYKMIMADFGQGSDIKHA